MDTDIAQYAAVDLLKELIATPSVSREEEAAADLIVAYLRQHNQTPQRVGNNVWAVGNFDAQKPTILLNSHIDTVKPVSTWVRNPFDPTEEDGEIIYGLGSNDAGASVVSLLHTFLLLQEHEQTYNLVFLASCQEEISGEGGVGSVLELLPKIDFAVVGEPTGMHVAIAEKGLLVIDGVVHGKSGHAARNEGVNAIYEALPLLEKLRTFRFEKESALLGAVKVSVTQINAGTQHNVVPDKCQFVVDVRTNELYSNEEVFKILSELTGCEMNARSFRLNSSGIATEHPFVRRAAMLGRNLFGSPTLSDQSMMPFPSVKIGPGDSARSHTADEYITRSEIREAIEYYVKLLDQLTLATAPSAI